MEESAAFFVLRDPGLRGLYVPWFWSLLLWSNQNLICLAVSTKKGPFCSDALLFSFLLSLISLAISWQFSVLGVLFALNLSEREGETEKSQAWERREKKDEGDGLRERAYFSSRRPFSNSSKRLTLLRTLATLLATLLMVQYRCPFFHLVTLQRAREP